jgi:hypothetical protein
MPVGRRTELAPLADQRRPGTHSQIVAIGRALDAGHLDRLFIACHAGQ